MRRVTEKVHELIEHEMQQEIDELKAHVARLREALAIEATQFKAIRCYTKDGKLAAICADHETQIRSLLAETTTQSLNHIKVQVRKEVIEGVENLDIWRWISASLEDNSVCSEMSADAKAAFKYFEEHKRTD